MICSAASHGYYAQLFHYEETVKNLKFICEDIIDAAGIAQLPFTHASEYTIVIDDAAYQAPGSSKPTVTPAPVVTPAPTVIPAPTQAPAATVPTSPKTEDVSEVWMLLMAAAFLTIGMGSVYSRRKRNVK